MNNHTLPSTRGSSTFSPRRAGAWALLVGSLIAANVVTAAAGRNPADGHQPAPAVRPAAPVTPNKTNAPAMPATAPTNPARAAATARPVQPVTATPAAVVPEVPEAAIDADKAMSMLAEGNARWVAGAATAPNTSPARRQNVADNGQKPFASILACADSRLPLERLFDRGIGDLFVVRVAGNVSGDSETGSLEYGVGHLSTPLLVVMGHTKCGAVGAAASGAQLHGKVAALVKNILPAVERARKNNPSATAQEITAIAVKENVWQSIFDLFKNSEEIRGMATSGKVRVIGAICDISTGKVEFLGEHPWQSELLTALAKDAKGNGASGASGAAPSEARPAQATVPDAKPGH